MCVLIRRIIASGGADLCWALEWNNLQFYPNIAPFSTLGGMKLDNYFFHVSKSSEDQKKGLHRKLNSFCSRNQVKTKQKVRRTLSATMLTIVKLLGGMQVQTIVKLLGGMQSNYWGDISPHPHRVSAPLIASHLCTAVDYQQFRKESRKRQMRIKFERCRLSSCCMMFQKHYFAWTELGGTSSRYGGKTPLAPH